MLLLILFNFISHCQFRFGIAVIPFKIQTLIPLYITYITIKILEQYVLIHMGCQIQSIYILLEIMINLCIIKHITNYICTLNLTIYKITKYLV